MNEIGTIRILTVDDDPLLHQGIASVIRSQPDVVLAAEASNGRDAISGFASSSLTLTRMDLRLPDLSGIDTLPSKELADGMRQVHAGKKGIPAEIAASLAEHYGD